MRVGKGEIRESVQNYNKNYLKKSNSEVSEMSTVSQPFQTSG